MADLKKTFVERRKGPDAVVKAVWWVVGISWTLIITAFFIALEAQPKSENFVDRLVNAKLRHYWDDNLLRYAFWVLLINFVVCIIGFVSNMLRQKRKTDKISKSIIILGAFTLSGIIWYLVRQ